MVNPPAPVTIPTTILHVDDDEANRYAVTRSLRKAGFVVTEAGSGTEALAKMGAKPDLVVLDVKLPDINGFEVCRRIKADPATPVLHFSATFVRATDKAEGLDTGADGYLVRPVDPVELVATINALLRARRSEEAMRKSEAHYRLLVENVKDYAILTASPSGDVTSFNPGAEQLFGYAAAEIIGRNAALLFTEEDRAAGVPAQELAGAAADGRAPDVRWHRKKDGSRVFVNGVTMAARDEYGNLPGFSKVGRDETERWKRDEALRAERARIELAQTAAQIGTFEWDIKADRNQWSPELEALYGLPPGSFGGTLEAWRQCAHPDDVTAAEEAIRQSLRSGRFDCEFRVIRPDGTVRWLAARAKVIRDRDGNAARMVGVNINVTDRKNAEQAIRDSEARYRFMAESMPQGVFTAAPDGRLDYVNQVLNDYLGRGAGEAAPGGMWTDLVHPDDRPLTAERWARAVETGEAYEVEHRVRRRDGNYRWFLVRARAMRGAAGQVVKWFGTSTDVDDQRRAAEERERLLEQEQRARAEAEAANRLKDEFLATLSHELRTPLNAILGWATILGGADIDADDLKEGLATIERNAKVQTQLIEDLLDVSRIISGKLRLDVQPVDLSAVIDAAVAAVWPAAEGRGVRLVRVIDPAAPHVRGDPSRLQQVAWNLLSNAIKFTPRGGRVEVTLARVNSHIELTVSDTGKGIPAEFLPYVFERFRQADASTKRNQGGLGLGLAIVRNLVELHGGTVHADSSGDGRGSVFTVKLPVSALPAGTGGYAPAEGANRLRPRGGEVHCPPQLTGLRVLVVDDEPDSRNLVKRILEDCDAHVTAAASAAEAMGHVRARPVDLVVSDIGMPSEDGYDLIRRLRALPAGEGGKIPAVALTAFARSEDRRRALLAGFQVHVPKPVDPAELVAVVAGLAGRTPQGGAESPAAADV